jgi:DNA-binding response OmpR family regulator
MIKIVLIEDNKDIRENTAEILQLANYKIFTARNGKDGIELVQKEKPDLIICDIMMPVLDGFGVLHLLSKNEDTASIPFIFLTAKAERTDFRKGMEMGADDYVTKPFDDIELLNAIESRLKKTQLLKKDFTKSLAGLNDFLTNAGGLDTLKNLTLDEDTQLYKKKERIYQEGQYPRGLYFIIKGKVKILKKNEEGKEFITDLFKEGDFFGYMALLEDVKNYDNAMALDDCEICMIPKAAFFNLIYKNAEVSKKFIKLIADNLKEKEDKLIRLAYNSVRKRVAEALITLNIKYRKEKEKIFTMSISREDLANIAGTATETTIRTLSDFKEEKIIEMKGSSITILNREKLESMRN